MATNSLALFFHSPAPPAIPLWSCSSLRSWVAAEIPGRPTGAKGSAEGGLSAATKVLDLKGPAPVPRLRKEGRAVVSIVWL